MNGWPEDHSPHELLARKIIGLAMKVHRELGCGFVESIYQEAPAIELRDAHIEFEIHPVLPVFYKGEQIGVFQADLIIENRLIVELKAIFAQRSSTMVFSSISARKASNSKPNTVPPLVKNLPAAPSTSIPNSVDSDNSVIPSKSLNLEAKSP